MPPVRATDGNFRAPAALGRTGRGNLFRGREADAKCFAGNPKVTTVLDDGAVGISSHAMARTMLNVTPATNAHALPALRGARSVRERIFMRAPLISIEARLPSAIQ